MHSLKHKPLALTIALALVSPAYVSAQSDAGDLPRELDRVVVTGTRVAGRSATDTAAPLDIIGVAALERSGSPELNQALSVALPSFNFPRPGLADGTDTIRPATLRGLSPDQSLVLVNSKRRHSSALVNVNGTVGRGAAAVDLNTIPTAAVRSIEVLRDGASAQYGSDAIAGVLNVLLRDERDGGSASVSYGVRETSYTTPVLPGPTGANWQTPSSITRDRSDGDTTTVSGWRGFGLGEDGFITLSAEYKDQKRTERGGYDYRQQYPLVNGQFDPREASVERFNAWYGEPDLEQLTLFGNAGIDLASGGRLYAWGSYQGREAKSAGFFRRALDDRNTIQIYPNGFLPIIAPDVDDYSLAVGYQWNLGEWAMDSSVVWGRNEMAFTIENTLNRSLGPASKTSFDAGGFDYDQVVLNFSGVRSVDVGAFSSPLNIATGVEARRESYSIFAGEPDSYRNGGVRLPSGGPTQSGSQVFPGFRPANEVDEDRDALGVYLDLEANITDQLLGSAAVRFEDYSDFGSNATGKLALRYDFTESFALRGSAQTGFRAPSPQQQFFTATSTNFINGVPFDITTFPVNDPVAIALGAQALDPEESVNFSLGAVFNFGDVSLTVDAYRIDIDDRIVLSENLTQANVRTFLESRGFVGIGGGRFFINGVDTETQGIDVVLNWPLEADSAGRFDFTLLGNYNETEVTRIPTTSPLAALSPAPPLFDRVNVLTFEEGTPENKFAAIVDWSLERFGATLRVTRYGEVLSPGTTAATDFVLSPKTLVDLESRVDFNDQWRLAIGAENVFDQYPDASPASLNTTGNTPYSNYSPFGRSGRLLYARLSYDF
ncbi:TonB-dependent receptor plug domain-containing protein [Aquimonas sp.]|jgi:iron complex outermembrane receptor protein|uniref:TonB-dependent receptor plug domain-containing protein n=1 Tax=Aquimonas sp. TaxID=1872588 RepID=UPI0037BE8E55